MVKDYLLFLHGVNVREVPVSSDDPNFPSYATPLFERIQEVLKDGTGTYNVEKRAIYYGDLNMEQERRLLDIYHSSPEWEHFWFRHVRETTLLQIIGDIALYVSPDVAARIVQRLHQVIIRLQQEEHIQQEGGRLHLVSHSLGTIILFDVLFASRWDREDVPGSACIADIREALCGLGTNPQEGIRIASIHTLGSPLPFFSLINMHTDRQKEGEHLHDIGPRLQQFLQHLAQNRGGRLLPWWNFSHPGGSAGLSVGASSLHLGGSKETVSRSP